MLQLLTKLKAKYGRAYRLNIVNLTTLMVTDTKLIEIVLSNTTRHLVKNSLYDFLLPWLGEGLLISSGKKWHGRRKIITPAFHFKILEQFVECFDKNSKILVEKLRSNCNGQVFDIHPFVSMMTLDVVCETAMGTSVNAQLDSKSAYVEAVHE